jgi:hypothetical protein
MQGLFAVFPGCYPFSFSEKTEEDLFRLLSLTFSECLCPEKGGSLFIISSHTACKFSAIFLHLAAISQCYVYKHMQWLLMFLGG